MQTPADININHMSSTHPAGFLTACDIKHNAFSFLLAKSTAFSTTIPYSIPLSSV